MVTYGNKKGFTLYLKPETLATLDEMRTENRSRFVEGILENTFKEMEQ